MNMFRFDVTRRLASWLGRMTFALLACASGYASVSHVAVAVADEPFRFRKQEIDRSLTVGYATLLVDMNDDQKPDIVVVDSERVIWLENPTWKLHTIIQGQTMKDNVCIAAHDIDGDGRVDFALGAHWEPANTQTGGTLQWLKRGEKPDDLWRVHFIAEEPTLHRIRWIDLYGEGKPELVVLPLFGRNTTRPEFREAGLRILSFRPPADPTRDRWPVETLNEDLHVAHNFTSVDLNGDGKLDLLVVSFEGVSLLEQQADRTWKRSLIGTGNQETSPNRGASEIKHGRLRTVNGKRHDYIATIEPWHGNQVVVYTRPAPGETLWKRRVLDEQLKWGHAVWCVNLDDDEDEELIIGVRDNLNSDSLSGVRIYDPQNPEGTEWKRYLIDPGGVAVEDLAAADLDGDGKVDIVAVGRATKNVRIYWNEGRAP